MSTVVTNKRASQSLRGQAVLVTLEGADISELTNFTKGILCTNDSSSKTGTIHSVDYYGTTFRISPIQPDMDFSSVSTYGYLALNETITVNTP